MTNFFTSIYKNHHYINKCKTVSTLRTMGFFNGTVDNREREREREMCYRRERLHERHPSLSFRLNIRCITNMYAVIIVKLKQFEETKRSNQMQ